MADPKATKHSTAAISALVLVLLLLAGGTAAWCRWVYGQIESYATKDEAASADAICVFGAAEYDGRPSPVYRARLNHALNLYRRGIAPLVITLGGWGGDQYSEGSVGRTYLMSQGIPASAIIAETQSRDTEESARRVAVIARVNGLRRLVIVSDGTHLFRIHAICAANGLAVLTSPRPRVQVEGGTPETERVAHEILSYTAWRFFRLH